LLRQHDAAQQAAGADASLLTAPTEISLLQRLAEYPSVLTQAAQELAPHQLAFWLRDCAADFHAWYNAERILVEDAALRTARLRLARATAQVIANGLGLLGVSAPERM
jgi:arginyl-tRNA synthetase